MRGAAGLEVLVALRYKRSGRLGITTAGPLHEHNIPRTLFILLNIIEMIYLLLLYLFIYLWLHSIYYDIYICSIIIIDSIHKYWLTMQPPWKVG